MRAIKFRRPFYNNKTNKFDGFHHWGVKVDGAQFVSPGSDSNCYSKEDEQYTGLKDKNGVEIYEGDILKGYGESITRYVVSFNKGNYELYHNFGRWGLLSRMFELGDEIPPLIIGNIHQNPELIK